MKSKEFIFKKIREISEEETANSAQVNPCESFHLVIHIEATRNGKKIGLYGDFR